MRLWNRLRCLRYSPPWPAGQRFRSNRDLGTYLQHAGFNTKLKDHLLARLGDESTDSHFTRNDRSTLEIIGAHIYQNQTFRVDCAFAGPRIVSTPRQKPTSWSSPQRVVITHTSARELSGSPTPKCNTLARDLQIEASNPWNSCPCGGLMWTNMPPLESTVSSSRESCLRAPRADPKHLASLIHPTCSARFTLSPTSPLDKSQTVPGTIRSRVNKIGRRSRLESVLC